MEHRIKIVNYVTAADVFFCILTHRIMLVQDKKGGVTELTAQLFQTSIIAFILFFMMVCAGVAVYAWKKVNIVPGSMEKMPEFPKLSFIVAVISIIIFTLYWMV